MKEGINFIETTLGLMKETILQLLIHQEVEVY